MHVTISRQVVQPEVIRLIAEAELAAVELAAKVELDAPSALRGWMGRLTELGLVDQP